MNMLASGETTQYETVEENLSKVCWDMMFLHMCMWVRTLVCRARVHYRRREAHTGVCTCTSVHFLIDGSIKGACLSLLLRGHVSLLKDSNVNMG